MTRSTSIAAIVAAALLVSSCATTDGSGSGTASKTQSGADIGR